jgi:predicted ArsR family transcriptional regulator
MVDGMDVTSGLQAASTLADPVRRRVFDAVAAAAAPVGRDDVAEEVGIGRSLAAYHLDLLAEQGLLTISFARRNGRTGRGAGRPAKLYERADVELSVQLPPRTDDLLAGLLAKAVEREGSGAALAALRDVTREAGQELGTVLSGATRAKVMAELWARGYEPAEASGAIRLRNCPFHHLVDDHRELVCGLNEELLGAMVSAAGVALEARLDPQPGYCCVVLQRRRKR